MSKDCMVWRWAYPGVGDAKHLFLLPHFHSLSEWPKHGIQNYYNRLQQSYRLKPDISFRVKNTVKGDLSLGLPMLTWGAILDGVVPKNVMVKTHILMVHLQLPILKVCKD